MPVSDLYSVYLKDHHAGAAGGLELAKHCREKNPTGALAQCLDSLIAEITKDRDALESVMRALDVQPSVVKDASSWLLEKTRRAMPNGRPFAYSSLSRLDELEALSLGIEGKRLLWVDLGRVQPSVPELGCFQFEALAARALQQRHTLEDFRLEAAEETAELAEPSGAGQGAVPYIHKDAT